MPILLLFSVGKMSQLIEFFLYIEYFLVVTELFLGKFVDFVLRKLLS